MRVTSPRSPVKTIVATLCAFCFLTMTSATVSRAVAAEDWPVWPKKTAEPGVEAKPPPSRQPAGAEKEGEEAGKVVKRGVSAGTIGWFAAGTAGVIAIAIAVGGGGGSTSNH